MGRVSEGTVMNLPFPEVIDSTMIADWRACRRATWYKSFRHFKPKAKSVHLHAGAAFAKGCEVGRKAFYDESLPEDAAIAKGMGALLTAYGSFECPAESAKSADRMAAAYEYGMSAYPMSSDPMQPANIGGKRAIEFSFVEPVDFVHPVTGLPILYSGRFDMIVDYAGQLFGLDDKTTSSLGASWSKQWDLRCFDRKTELLTREGWKRVDKLQEGEEVVQWQDGQLEFVCAKDVHGSIYEGDMISLQASRLDQLVTPNHRTPLFLRRGGQKAVEAGKLHKEDRKHKIPLSGHLSTEKLPAAMQQYVAALQADGTLRKSKGLADEGQGHREHMPFPGAQFNFTKERKRVRLLRILKDMAANYTVQADGGIYISGFERLQEMAMMLLTPEKMFKADTFELYDETFLEELEHWDGWNNQYYTVVRSNAEFVQTVAHTNGWRASVQLKINHTQSYVVCLSKQTTCELAAMSISERKSDGTVFCLSVPSGFVLTKRNDCVSVSGNSQFTAYCWGAAKASVPLAGFIVRGLAILKTKFDTQQAITYRPDWMIAQWYESILEDLRDMRDAWERDYWKPDFSEACNAYGGCEFRRVCLSKDPTPWLENDFARRVWDPITRTETEIDPIVETLS